jgi:DNA modification methylase
MKVALHHGDCLDVLRTLPDNSVDSVVTDPPYGLAFMNKKWDYEVPSIEIWAECLRALKPGGHLLAFAGTRTQHRMAVRIEDAGFEIRDMVAWVYGSGFPKSLDVSKAIDKAAGAERDVVGPNPNSRPNMVGVKASVLSPRVDSPITAPATEAAKQWEGWGTALKPALEPITVARKPLVGTVASNVLTYGTGGLNVDGCRVPHDEGVDLDAKHRQHAEGTGRAVGKGFVGSIIGKEIPMYKPGGRWPANLIHDGSEDVLSHLGSAARFFYCAKASKKDRDEGLDDVAVTAGHDMTDRKEGSAGLNNPRTGAGRTSGARNHHPTVKPTDLMRYLCRLVTPPGGVVLDPFMGSGSTGKAAKLEGFSFIGIEREAEYMEIARKRIG